MIITIVVLLIAGVALADGTLSPHDFHTSVLGVQSAFKPLVSIEKKGRRLVISEDEEFSNNKYVDFRVDAEIRYFNLLRDEARQIGLSRNGLKELVKEHLNKSKTSEYGSNVVLIKELSENGIECILAGKKLAELSTPEIVTYLRSYCVVKDPGLVNIILKRRLMGDNVDLFESVFNIEKRLSKRYSEGLPPIKIVHIRGGRGAADITREWKDLVMQKNVDVDLIIVPGAVDDGGSWADIAFYLHSTGVPDMGKSHSNMGTDEIAVEFSETRLTNDKNIWRREDGLKILREIIKGFSRKKYDVSNEDVRKVVVAFRKLPIKKQREAVKYIRRFYERIRFEEEKKGHNIDIRSLPMRSILIVGANISHGSWQKAVDVFGEFVGSAGRVILPTEERLHAMAILSDGTILPTENAINESQKNSEYLYFTLGPNSFVENLVTLSIFLKIAGREPTEEEKEKIEQLRVMGYQDLKGVFVDLLKDRTIEEKQEAVDFIERNLSFLRAHPKIRVQPDAIKALSDADVINFGPTDIESNIASAVLYPEIIEAIRSNQRATKVLIANSKDPHGIEPIGTTVGSQLERLYRYLSDQQRYLADEVDLEENPMEDFVQYVLGRDEACRGAADEIYIPFDRERIDNLGALPIDLDLEMQRLGEQTGFNNWGGEYRRMDEGKYNSALTIDINLSLYLMREADYPLEDLERKLLALHEFDPGTDRPYGAFDGSFPDPKVGEDNAGLLADWGRVFIDTALWRAREAKKLYEQGKLDSPYILIGNETSWIPREQLPYMQKLLNKLSMMSREKGLDNIIIKRRNGTALAGVLSEESAKRAIPNFNIIILGARDVLNSVSFDCFREGTDPEKWAFFAGIVLPGNFSSNSYVGILEMITRAMDLWSGVSRRIGDTPFINVRQEGKRIYRFIIPESEPMAYGLLQEVYLGQLASMQAA